jgi:hypothetical protein
MENFCQKGEFSWTVFGCFSFAGISDYHVEIKINDFS